MIKKWLFLAIALLVGTATSAQVGIGSPAPHPSARLELDATDKGFLPPRLTTQQRDEIANPAEGLTIYNTTINCLEFWNGTMWYNPCCPAPMQPSEIAGESEPCIGTSLIYSVVEVDGVSYNWTTPGNWVVTNGAGTHQITVTVGSDSGSIEVVPSNDCGNGSGRTLVATPRTVASTPSAGVHAPDINSITWQWSEVAGADGYRHNTVDDFDTATDTSNASFNQEGLDCETEYTLYVWAYNDCGQSTTLALTESTLDCPIMDCGYNVTFVYNSNEVTYGTVGVTYKEGEPDEYTLCWMDRNLGAERVPESSTDALGFGDLFQWGRPDDGHQYRFGPTSEGCVDSDTPSPANHFRLVPSAPRNWRCPPNGNLWQGVDGVNNPCPTGWRLATSTELENERQTWTQNGYVGAYNSPLKWPRSRWRNTSGGGTGDGGYVWSSTTESGGQRSIVLRYFDGSAYIGWGDRGAGFSVRCVRD